MCLLENAVSLRNSLFEAGGGAIGNYEHSSFSTKEKVLFKEPKTPTQFWVRKEVLQIENETKISILFERKNEAKILKCLQDSASL